MLTVKWKFLLNGWKEVLRLPDRLSFRAQILPPCPSLAGPPAHGDIAPILMAVTSAPRSPVGPGGCPDSALPAICVNPPTERKSTSNGSAASLLIEIAPPVYSPSWLYLIPCFVSFSHSLFPPLFWLHRILCFPLFLALSDPLFFPPLFFGLYRIFLVCFLFYLSYPLFPPFLSLLCSLFFFCPPGESAFNSGLWVSIIFSHCKTKWLRHK